MEQMDPDTRALGFQRSVCILVCILIYMYFYFCNLFSIFTALCSDVGGAGSSNNAQANKDMLDNVKKCKNFLSTLLKLAGSQPPDTVTNVRDLIQGLVVSLSYSTFFKQFFYQFTILLSLKLSVHYDQSRPIWSALTNFFELGPYQLKLVDL